MTDTWMVGIDPGLQHTGVVVARGLEDRPEIEVLAWGQSTALAGKRPTRMYCVDPVQEQPMRERARFPTENEALRFRWHVDAVLALVERAWAEAQYVVREPALAIEVPRPGWEPGRAAGLLKLHRAIVFLVVPIAGALGAEPYLVPPTAGTRGGAKGKAAKRLIIDRANDHLAAMGFAYHLPLAQEHVADAWEVACKGWLDRSHPWRGEAAVAGNTRRGHIANAVSWQIERTR